jgi:hypothetical protein
MPAYRFVGTSGEIYDTKFSFKRYGQLVDMPDDIAQRAIAAGFPLLTDQEFKDVTGHTDEEVKKWGGMIGHATVPADVAAKRNKAWAIISQRHIAIQDAKAAERAKADAEAPVAVTESAAPVAQEEV